MRTVIRVAAAAALLTACSSSGSGSGSGSGSSAPAPPVTATPPPTAAPSIPTTVVDDGCDLPAPTVFDQYGSVHTITPQPASAALRLTIELTPSAACPGGQVHAVVTVTNPTGEPLEFQPTRGLILGVRGQMARWSVAPLAPATVQPGETIVRETTIVVPDVLPGRYRVFAEGYEDHTTLAVLANG